MSHQWTRVKAKDSICVVCNRDKNLLLVNSAIGKKKKLHELLIKYGELDVIEGCICRMCERKLFHIHSECTKFRNKCKASLKVCSLMSSGPTSQPETPVTFPQDMFIISNRSQGESTERRIPVTIQPAHEVPLPMHEAPADDKPSIKPVARLIVESLKIEDNCLTNSDCATIVRAMQTKVLGELLNTIDALNTSKHAIQQKIVAVNDAVLCGTMKSIKTSPSVMLHTDGKSVHETLVNFSWESCVDDFYKNFPAMCSMLVGMMLPKKKRCSETAVSAIFPRLGLIYGIIVQCRIPYLSRVQRMISAILLDSMIDVKGYERLEPTGMCLSYCRTERLLDAIQGEFDAKVIDAVKNGQKIRLVGENVEVVVGCREERSSRHAKMLRYFGSAVTIHDLHFPEANCVAPQIDYHTLEASDLLPNANDFSNLIADYTHMVMHVAIKHISYFKFLNGLIPTHLSDENGEQLQSKTVVALQHVLEKDEHNYRDVVDILQNYETTMKDVHDKAGVPFTDKNIQIGGNRLTREHFSEAKRLLNEDQNAANHFKHLSPITTEFYCISKKLLSLAFKRLFNASSVLEIGTMKSLEKKLERKTVNRNVSDTNLADKNFFISLTDTYIVEAILHYFEIGDTTSSPAKLTAPENVMDRLQWSQFHFQQIVQKFVGTFIAASKTGVDSILSHTHIDIPMEVEIECNVEPDQSTHTVQLPNGQEFLMDLNPVKQVTDTSIASSSDKVQAYAQLLLELGLLFKNFTDCIKVPNRPRMLRTLKLTMTLLKADNSKSKHADEILRFLVHQICTLSEHDAKLAFYSMFINTQDGIDSHIANDQLMECVVKTYKKHIRHVICNQADSRLERKTAALGSLFDVTARYDDAMRSRSKPSEMVDKSSAIKDLQQLQPFKQTDNRFHDSFKNVQLSLLSELDYQNLLQWSLHRAEIHATSLVN